MNESSIISVGQLIQSSITLQMRLLWGVMGQINSFLPLQLFESGQLLRIPSHCKGGLILQQPHHAEFAGAGAAVGSHFDIKCVSLYTIGDLQFDVPIAYVERRQAYRRRIAYMDRQQKITANDVPFQRAYLMVRQLCVWLNQNDAQEIPHELIAQLVGVLPNTVTIAWRRYLIEHPSNSAEPPASCRLPMSMV